MLQIRRIDNYLKNKGNPVFNISMHVTLIKKKKKNEINKYPVYIFSKHVQHYKIF